MNAKQVQALKPKDKMYRVSCGDSLFIEVQPSGRKLWRYRFRWDGRESMLSLGTYPAVSLADARKKRDAERDLLDAGQNPAEVRRQAEAKSAGKHTFRAQAEEFFDAKAKQTRTAAEDSRKRFVKWVYPKIGGTQLDELEFNDVLAMLRRIEKAGKGETARRVRADVGRIFKHAMASGLVKHDPTPLPAALVGHKPKPYPVITDPKKLAGVLRAIEGYDGETQTRIALQLLPRLLMRPGELRKLLWAEVFPEEIRLPESKTKQGTPHVVPLSTQAKTLFANLHNLTGDSKYCFPSFRSNERPMSDNTCNAALRRLGYKGNVIVGHSFRKIGSTFLHEQGYPSEWVERQLGHVDRDKIRATYNYAQHLDDRRVMMQEWSDWLDELIEG